MLSLNLCYNLNLAVITLRGEAREGLELATEVAQKARQH